MKKTIAVMMISVLFSGCWVANPDEESFLEFSLSGEKTSTQNLYVNEAIDLLEMEASLTLRDGEISLQIMDEDRATVIWENRCTESMDFQIVLSDLQAGTNLTMVVQTNCDSMKLSIVSPVKLAEDPVKTEKPAPSIPS